MVTVTKTLSPEDNHTFISVVILLMEGRGLN